MRELFVNRDRELEALEAEIGAEGLRIALVYGRRRVGKTWLARALLSKLGGTYVFVPEGGRVELARSLVERLKQTCRELRPGSWESILEGLANCATDKGGLLVVIDEFQRLGAEFASQLQLLVDTRPEAPLKLILLGSAVSAVERLAGVLGPLYGRSLTIRLAGFRFLEAYVYLRETLGATPLEAFRLYAVLGGSPYNLSLARSRDWRREALTHIHSVYGRLYEEPIHILASETRDLGTYTTILAAIASGRQSFSEIAHLAKRTSLIKYLELLRSLGLVERVVPAGEDPLRTRKAKYMISDPYWDYWFKMIYPRRDEAEITGELAIDEDLAEKHMSVWFERVARELVSRIHGVRAAPWWSKATEIDIVAPTGKGAYVYEVKYSKLDSREAERELNKLRVKAKALPMPAVKLRLITIETERSGDDYEAWSFEDLVAYALKKSRIGVRVID